MRRGLCHAPASAGGTEAPALEREGDHAIEPARVAVHAHEAVGEDAPELALDETGHAALTRLRAGHSFE